MRKFKLTQFPLFILLSASLACSNATPVPAPQLPDLGTVIAETAAVALSQTALAQPPLPSSTVTSQATFTATAVPTQTLTPTLAFTPTSQIALIAVSVATNCRNGPGKVYDYEGALLVGEVAQVYARDPSGEFWYVRNPDSSGDEFCWLWGKYAALIGDLSALPMYTPPPTPTATNTPLPTATGTVFPSFVATYSGLDTCSGNWWLDLKLRNNGQLTFKSIDVVVRDMTTGITLEDLANGFKDKDGCSTTKTKDVLAVGDLLIISAPQFAYNPSGHKIKINLTLCSEPNQKGVCAKQNLELDL
ncbi:MAG: hypothetical protein IT310_07855 [Anaerolineales bacterium]|nr:hypothetical protein [Anaerolineales bacterium]